VLDGSEDLGGRRLKLELIAPLVRCAAAYSCASARINREGNNLDKTIMSLLGGASALALLGGYQASAASAPVQANLLQPARSFAELLDPIPNAESVLRAEVERTSNDTSAQEKPMVEAQYYHHHHHHYHHHHYHHHHYHHHHYHHHHHYY
jgi:hypothetical protein